MKASDGHTAIDRPGKTEYLTLAFQCLCVKMILITGPTT